MTQNISLKAPGQKYKHIANAGTTVVKTTGGLIDHININGGATGATVAIFDQATTVTGTISVGTITVAGTIFPIAPINYNVLTNTGIVMVTTGTVDLTVAFT